MSGLFGSISRSAQEQNDPCREELGVIVAHQYGRHGCCFDNTRSNIGEGDERCYLCHRNPFYEVIFHSGEEQTLRIAPHRAFERVVEVGACLLLRLSAIAELLPGFKMQVCCFFHTTV